MTTFASPTTGVAVRPRSTHGRAWTVIGFTLALLLIAAVAASFIGSIAYQPIPSSRRVFAAAITAVTVDVGNGSVTIESAMTGGAVVETSGIRGLSSPTDSERVIGSTLAVRSGCTTMVFENHCSRDYVLHVPSRVPVAVHTDEGDVTVRDIEGSLTLRSDEGDVDVDQTSGSAHLSSGEGDVKASGLSGATVTASSGQGDVRLGFAAAPRAVTAASGEGDVTVKLPRSAVAYQVHTASGEGLATSNVVQNPTSRRIIRATSGEGDVTVGYQRG